MKLAYFKQWQDNNREDSSLMESTCSTSNRGTTILENLPIEISSAFLTNHLLMLDDRIIYESAPKTLLQTFSTLEPNRMIRFDFDFSEWILILKQDISSYLET